MNKISTVAKFLPIIFLSACIFISDEEVERRILRALPSEASLKEVDFSKHMSCLTATFTLRDTDVFTSYEQREHKSSNKDLGSKWVKNTSFYEYVESVSEPILKNSLEATAGLSKSMCFTDIGIEPDIFYKTGSIITATEDGEEIIILTIEDKTVSGIYMIHGR